MPAPKTDNRQITIKDYTANPSPRLRQKIFLGAAIRGYDNENMLALSNPVRAFNNSHFFDKAAFLSRPISIIIYGNFLAKLL
jgi:hypothetical protein